MDAIDKRMLRLVAQSDQTDATIVEALTSLPLDVVEYHRHRVHDLADEFMARGDTIMGFILLLGAYYASQITVKAAYDGYKEERDKTP